MTDPASEIRHLLRRYEEAMAARDLPTLGELHWQDERFVHLGPGGAVDQGWPAYERRLAATAEKPAAFRLTDLRIEVFHGKFAVAGCSWSGGAPAGAGASLFVLSRMGNSWKIVAGHQSSGSAPEEGGRGAEAGTRTPKP
ncbi:MAG TPA: nuclear transport factor 2 family protein [Candidatus Polarisedimenticolia bacterium]|nr:nuclear transport factor 2 family protein [Candidatus Polarisedimenticolia bacterium]